MQQIEIFDIPSPCKGFSSRFSKSTINDFCNIENSWLDISGTLVSSTTRSPVWIPFGKVDESIEMACGLGER